jgi:hypothetical protein
MTTRLALYGSAEHMHNYSKVGGADKAKTPRSLVDLMPSPEIAAKVGGPVGISGARTRRVVRRNERG